MAVNDILFSEGEKQNFILEIPTNTYVGRVLDITVEQRSESDAMEVELDNKNFLNRIVKTR